MPMSAWQRFLSIWLWVKKAYTDLYILINIYLTLGVVLCGGLTFFDPYPCMHNACSKYRMAVRDIHQFFAEVSAVPITHDGKARLFCD